jgi:NAD(P)-dependent dehydrogenase (short-subunit alcohol dehydrogenase family)
MRQFPMTFSRRQALIGALAALVGSQVHPALAQAGRGAAGEGQNTTAGQVPWDAAHWAKLGVSLRGRTAMVTGSTDGLGVELARQLGALGALVIVHGRNSERGEEVVRAIRAAGPGDAVFYRADLGSLAEVRALAEQVRSRHDRLHLLINNAAAVGGNSKERRTSADGHELAFAVNYLSHFLLTQLLLPRLEAGAPARIVNVSSLGQAPVDLDDLMMTRGAYDSSDAYRRSKLAQIMFTIDLAARLDPSRVTVTAVHPARSMNTPRVIGGGSKPLSTVEEGAASVMQLAVSPELAGRTGVYYNQLVEGRANAQAYDAAARTRLWTLSAELTGLASAR